MKRMTSTSNGPAMRRIRAYSLTVVSLAAFLACDTSRLLNVQAPNSVPATVFDDPANATLMVNSVIGDFECGFGGFVTTEGMATDEFQDATITAANWQLDRRDDGFTSGSYGTGGCTATEGIYTPMSTARSEADAAITRLNGWTDAQVANRQLLLAEANVYAGFAYTTMGMAMCQASFDLGKPVDQIGMFALAEKRFTDAIAAAQTSGQTTMLNAAYAGRARVRLFQHNLTGAISDAQLVPKGFVFNANNDATTSRRFNHVFNAISTAGSMTVEASTRALTTENGEVDPRSAMTKLTTKPADGTSLMFIPTKYNAASLALGDAIPQPIARYEEAQLILAEAQGGAQAVSIINTLRAAVNLKPYTGATDAASIKSLIISERQRALYAEGFRAFDVERFSVALTPAPGLTYRFGGVYGHTVCLPLPDVERVGNPNVDPATLISGVQGQFTPP
jgi:starch-binding outer membrane protein, SusD/RagB family